MWLVYPDKAAFMFGAAPHITKRASPNMHITPKASGSLVSIITTAINTMKLFNPSSLSPSGGVMKNMDIRTETLNIMPIICFLVNLFTFLSKKYGKLQRKELP